MSRAFIDDPERVARLHELLDAGAGVHEIAFDLGVSVATVCRVRKRLGRSAVNRDYDAELIVELRDEGLTYNEIRDTLGVSVQTLWRVLRERGRVVANGSGSTAPEDAKEG